MATTSQCGNGSVQLAKLQKTEVSAHIIVSANKSATGGGRPVAHSV